MGCSLELYVSFDPFAQVGPVHYSIYISKYRNLHIVDLYFPLPLSTMMINENNVRVYEAIIFNAINN